MGWQALHKDWLPELRGSLRAYRWIPAVSILAGALGLSACASNPEKLTEVLSSMPAIGLPADAPARPATPAAYPAVHDMPPQRPEVLLNDVEQQRLEDELVAARTRQQAETAGGAASAKKRPTPPARVIPAASKGVIY